MAETSIEWAEKVWNPVVGCSLVSPGCGNCYAMRVASARLDGNAATPHYAGTTHRVNGKPVWTGKVALAPERKLREPLAWKKPARIFVNSMGDLFHEDVPDEWIGKVFAVMATSPHHDFMVLTKRSGRMRAWCSSYYGHHNRASPEPFSNIWLGVSAERQQEADARIPDLLATPAAVRFVSAEPLLGPLDLIGYDHTGPLCDAEPSLAQIEGPNGAYFVRHGASRLDWIICGGESGPGARPMNPAWARSVRDQCETAGVAYFHKQNGEWATHSTVSPPTCDDWGLRSDVMHFDTSGNGENTVYRVGKRRSGRLLDGIEHNAMPGSQS